ncbi:MAG: glycosyltransferase family 39 protein [Lewinella sp.]|nr:glycosyltransferase family 39 protein [Lewinella sp.]
MVALPLMEQRSAKWWWYFPWSSLAFWGMALCFFLMAYGHHSVFFKPKSIHAWRQADSASQFRMYYQEDISFWTPRWHSFNNGNDNIATSEFPVTYFVSSRLARWFGYSEAWSRGLHFFLFVLGLFYLFRLGRLLLSNPLWAWFPPLFYLLSPACFYYANNYLPNMPAISLALIGWYFMYRYRLEPSWRHLGLWAGLFTLAALIKPSEGLHMVVALAFLSWEYLGAGRPPGVARPWGRLLTALAFFVLVFGSWVYYVWHDGNNVSLLGILPLWEGARADNAYTWQVLRELWMPALASWPLWLATALALLALLFHRRGYLFRRPSGDLASVGDWELFRPWRVTMLMLGASAAYFLLWFQAFRMHDYYLLTLTVAPAFVWLSFFRVYEIWFNRGRRVWILLAVLLGLLVSSAYHNRQVQAFRNWEYGDDYTTPALRTIEPQLREMGIPRTAKVVIAPDPSPNISLYMANNPGWNAELHGGVNDLRTFQSMGAEYFILKDSSLLDKPGMRAYLGEPIGKVEEIAVYRLDVAE